MGNVHNKYLKRGDDLSKLKRYDEAIEQYKLALKYNPSNSIAYHNLGNSLRKLKRYEEAIEQYKLAIQHNPSFSIAYHNLGVSLDELKRYEEAIEQYKLALQYDPSYSNAYYNMGLAFRKLKRDEEAIEKYKLAVQYNPSNSTAYNNMGVIFNQLNRNEEAIEQYKLAIQYNPSYSSAYHNMGVALDELKRYEEAIEQFKLAVQYNSSYSSAYHNMGVALDELKRYEEAIEQYKLAVQYDSSHSRAYNNMGNTLDELKRYEEAIEQYKLAIHYDPSYSNAYYNMGLAFRKLNRDKEAIEQYKLAVQYNPSNSSAYYNMGVIFNQLNRNEEAIEQYKLAIQYNQSFSSAYYNMGNILDELKRYEEAIEQYKLAVQYNPSDSTAYNNMGFSLRKLKRYEEAIEQYKLALQYNLSISTAYYNMGLTYYNKGRELMIMGRYNEAEEEYKHSIEQLILSPTTLSLSHRNLNELNKVNIGWIMIKRRDFQSTNKIYTFELNNQLFTDEGKLIKAILLYKEREYHSSLSLFHDIDITKFNNYFHNDELIEFYYYYYYMAMCLWKLMKNGENKEVEEERRIKIMELLNKAIENDKEWVKPYYRRAQLLSLQASLSEVIIADFQFVIKSNQQNAPFNQLSLSKITSLLSLLQKEDGKKEENKQEGNIIHLDEEGIINVDEKGEISPQEQIKNEEHIHIDAEGLNNVEYKGVVELIEGYSPPRSCVDHILSDLPQVLIGIENHIQPIVNQSILIAEDRIQRINGGIILSKDEAIAIASYSFDLGYHSVDRSGNLYQILNNVLRERNGDKMRKLQAYLYYLMTALAKLNAVKDVVYRGIPSSHKQNVEDIYLSGSKIHWSAFTSTTTSLDKAKVFAEGKGGIIFRIRCLTGRFIRPYSSYPQEDEVLLSPNCSLTVTKELHLKADGYYYVDFVENRNNLVLF